MYGLGKDPEPFGSCVVRNFYWSECMPGKQPSRQECLAAGCCWNELEESLNFCHHSLPARQNYQNKTGSTQLVARLERSPFGAEPLTLSINIAALNTSHVLVQLIAEGSASDSIHESRVELDETDIKIDLTEGEAFFVELKRRTSNETLFFTGNGPLIATQGFWEWSLQFPHDALLLGSGSTSRGSLRLTSGSATLYQGLGTKANGRPFILCVTQSGKSHGVLFEAPGAIEVVARPSNLISIRSTAGAEYLNVHTFVGNSPAEVFEALTAHIGLPTLPPYWSLGLHVCRDTARNGTNEDALNFKNEATRLDFPYDSDCVDDSALGNVSYVVEGNRVDKLKTVVTELKNSKRHFLLSLYAQVSERTTAFEEGQDIFLVGTNGTYLGQHRDETVAYPDFENPNVTKWLDTHMSAMLANIQDVLPSGLILSDNWPLNEDATQGDGNETLEYVPQGLDSLSNGTVLWSASGVRRHQSVHNQYGSLFTTLAKDILEQISGPSDKRLPVLGSSNWLGGNTNGWLGEEQQADWQGLKSALLSVMEAGISGEPFSGGGPICGSSGVWSDSLCTRWSLLALTTFPLTRFHHRWGSTARDPTALDETSGRIVARAVRLRYQLMPYLYTWLHRASLSGMPLVRPMAVEFPTDNSTWTLEEQFMVGPSLMAAPVFEPAAVSLTIYLPRSTESWFHLLGGERVQADVNGTGHVTLYAPENELILLIKEGHIIALQGVNTSSAMSRAESRQIIVALECGGANSSECTAEGTLSLDDGVSNDLSFDTIQFSANQTSLVISYSGDLQICSLGGTENMVSTVIDTISIYGVPGNVTNASNLQVDDVIDLEAKFFVDTEEGKVRISSISVDWCSSQSNEMTVSWEIE
ncbi:Hypothetical predicted protein [Cloeon dipterum]|nr:Hypothetical predicted protein [Cloeon dipterum]